MATATTLKVGSEGTMDRKLLTLIIPLILICILGAAIMVQSQFVVQKEQPTKPFEFTVSGASDCLRFLNSSVPIVYVPFTVAANENWQLMVNCTKMPGGANGWTDVYIYKGYWDQGTNHTCRSWDVYPIINDIQAANFQIKANQPYTQTFGNSTQQSYTVFFVIPPGGPATFHVTYKQAQ